MRAIYFSSKLHFNLLWTKDPGQSWSRVTQILHDELILISGKGGRGVCLLRLENCNFTCYSFG
jgi:hypothetical protein